MEKEFDLFRRTREHLLDILSNHSLAELNYIPEGFNNNLFWNIYHCLVTQQLLHYYLSGLPMLILQQTAELYRKGTKPTHDGDLKTLRILKRHLQESTELLMRDYNKGKFADYQPYSTSYGVELHCIEDAIKFNNTHEALHLGFCMALVKNLP